MTKIKRWLIIGLSFVFFIILMLLSMAFMTDKIFWGGVTIIFGILSFTGFLFIIFFLVGE